MEECVGLNYFKNSTERQSILEKFSNDLQSQLKFQFFREGRRVGFTSLLKSEDRIMVVFSSLDDYGIIMTLEELLNLDGLTFFMIWRENDEDEDIIMYDRGVTFEFLKPEDFNQ
jgi:hypothetical protein